MNSHPTLIVVFAAALLLIGVACKPAEQTVTDTPESEPKASTAPVPVPATSEVKHLDASGAADLIDENSEIVVLDIRTPEEFAGGHIQGALNIDFKAPSFRDEIAKLDPAKSYLVHCRSGGRSTSSLPVFEELGFTGIIHLDGGFDGWRAAGNASVTD